MARALSASRALTSAEKMAGGTSASRLVSVGLACAIENSRETQKNPARLSTRRIAIKTLLDPNQDAAAFGARLRELRWKNSAWLATADTMAGWNGFEIRNAGSGRSPVRKRSG